MLQGVPGAERGAGGREAAEAAPEALSILYIYIYIHMYIYTHV